MSVLITGASGFLALWIIGDLLEKSYKVIGTVRSESKKSELYSKFETKYTNFDRSNLILEIVPDIADLTAFDEVLQKHQDIKTILHTASPFAYGFTDDLEKGYLIPAKNGTLNILQAAKKFAPQLTKVVITSSQASVVDGSQAQNPEFVHTEKTWNPMVWADVKDERAAYVTSKAEAERAAWEFVKSNEVNFKLNTICPPFIFGPQFFDQDAQGSKLNTSAQVIKDLLQSDPSNDKLFDAIKLTACDVRDVSKFHLIAFENEAIVGERLFPIADDFSLQSILNIINENFPKFNGKIAKGDPAGAHSLKAYNWNNDYSKKLVGGFEFIPLKQQVVDAVNQLVQNNEDFKEYK